MKKKNRIIASFLSALALTLAIVGCGRGVSQQVAPGNSTEQVKSASGGTGDTIKIGVIVAETGPASALGKPEADAARLVKKQLEASGGINGKRVEIVVKDYETNDTNAVVTMKKLISEDKVIGVVGGTQTSTSIAIGEVAKEKKVPLIALGVLNQIDNRYIFQVPQSNQVVLGKIVDFLKKQNIKTVAWTNARDGFGQSGLPIFKKMASENGIEIVAVEDFDPAATDMTVQLTKIKPKNPGAVIVWSRPPAAGIIVKNFKQLGFAVPMIQSHAVSNKGFIDQVGADGEGILVLGSKLNAIDQLMDPEYKEMLRKFDEEFKKQYNYSPGAFGGYAYDGLQMLLKGIAAGYDTPEKLTDFLENRLGVYKGISGTFKIAKEDHNGLAGDGMGVFRIQNQSWQLAE